MKSKPNYRIYCKISTIPKSGLNIIAFYPSNYLGTNPQLNSNFLRTTIVLSKDANSSIASFTIMKELKALTEMLTQIQVERKMTNK